MAHPNDGIGHVGKQGARLEISLNAGVLADGSLLHPAAEHVRHQLHAVANAQHRHAEGEHLGKAPAAVLRVNAVGAAGKDNAG